MFGSLKEPEKREWNEQLGQGGMVYNDSVRNLLQSASTDDIGRYEKYVLR